MQTTSNRKFSTSLWIVAVAALLPVAAFASGPAQSGTATVPQTGQASVTVPQVIALDVESSFAFDFSDTGHYHAPASPTDCTDAFPPGTDCTNLTFTPSTVSGPASQTANNIWIAIFSSATGHDASMDVSVSGPAAFSGDPGFTPQKLRLKKATSSNVAVNGANFGWASPVNVGTVAVPQGLKDTATTMTSSVFGWKRIDQIVDLYVPASTNLNVVTGVNASLTFTLAY